MKHTALFCLSLFLLSCIPLSIGKKISPIDFSPPRFTDAAVTGERSIRLRFDKACTVPDNKPVISSGLTVQKVSYPEEGIILIETNETQVPGKEYVIDLTVADASGNTTTLMWAFYGFNSRIPRLQLNEICVNGSTTRPDMAEILSLSEGNLAGVCLYHGSPSDYKSLFIFPNAEVKAGEMILVHFKPEGLAAEVQETGALDESGGKMAHPNARDFWVEGGSGLSGTNGALTLYDTPNGTLIEAFLYSNRTSASDTAYNGFGSASFLTNVTEITEAGGWEWSSEIPRPDECFNPTKSTSTRTINRRPDSPSGSRFSWFIGATSTASFGEPNTDKEYF